VNYFSDRLSEAVKELPDDSSIRQKLQSEIQDLEVVSNKVKRFAISPSRRASAKAANIIQGFGFDLAQPDRQQRSNQNRNFAPEPY
jgi:hypothetical protein